MSASQGFVVYRSSAGSGKTFTLVKEYLKLALDDGASPPTRFRTINAITFTNKAAAEMKERVIKTLQGMATGNPPTKPYVDVLTRETGIGEELLRTRAAELLTAILHHYSDFSISTIDSFTHRVIRSFAHDLHLPVQFEISTDRNKVISEAVDLFLDGTGKDDPVSGFLLDFTRQFIEDEKNWDIRGELISFAETLSTLEDPERLTALLKLEPAVIKRIRSRIFLSTEEFRKKLSKAGKEALLIIEQHDLQPGDFYQGAKGIPGWFSYIEQVREDKFQPNSYVEKSIYEEKWVSGKVSKQTESAVLSAAPLLKKKYQEITALLEKESATYFLYRLLYRNIDLLAIYRSIHSHLEEYRSTNNIVLISDLNQLISSIVAEQPAPFIYERLGSRYRNYLIDEFQDTSVLQWTNLLPLIHQSLSEGHFNMVVGDSKQAIYRFRGGDADQFTRLPEIRNEHKNFLLEERSQALKDHFQLKQLGVNYRSAGEIVRFNNELYATLSAGFSPQVQQVFRDNTQETSADKKDGQVVLEFLNSETSPAQRTEQIIHSLKEKGFAYRSIAVLTRNNTEASEIARHLQKNNIPVVSTDSMLIAASPEVQFVLALLKLQAEDSHLISRTIAVEYLSKTGRTKKSKAELYELCTDKKGLTRLLESCGLPTGKGAIKKLSLPELTEFIIESAGIHRKADPYLLSFSDLILHYTKRNGNDLNGFLEWWEERKYKEFVTIPEGIDAVKIMTIHKSKGLEFPVVILPECNWDTQKLHDKAWVELNDAGLEDLTHAILPISSALENTVFKTVLKEERDRSLLDNLNLLYVATTRASEELHILTTHPVKKNDLSHWFIRFLNEKGLYENEKNVYSFGSPPPAYTAIASGTSYTLPGIISANWRKRVKLRRRYRENSVKGVYSSSRNKGLIIHEALSGIQEPGQLKAVLTLLISKGKLLKKEEDSLQEDLMRILNAESIRPFFSGGKMISEKDLLLPDGEIIRPDRIIRKEDETFVIDFKTGREKEEHKKQVLRYATLLQAAGYPKVSAYLIYTDSLTVKKV